MKFFDVINSQNFRQILLIILLAITIAFAVNGGFTNPDWGNFLYALSTSVMATLLSVYFLQDIDKKPDIDYDKLSEVIHNSMIELNSTHFVRIDRNMDMGKDYWVNLIDTLDSCSQPVWFVGTRLSWWLGTGTYKEPLRMKFYSRLQNVVKKYDGNGHDIELCDENFYKTNILLTDPNYISQWNDFFARLIKDLSKSSRKNNDEITKLLWSRIKIGLLSPDQLKYSLVLCGDRLTITPYTSNGRSEDSPTFEIASTSVVRNVYLDDLKLLDSKADVKTKKLEK